MSKPPTLQPCVGCGALVADWDGPAHAYIGASPGCWRVYGDVLAREYGELRNPGWHRLTVDAYAAQHAGVESRRSTQSVCAHLVALQLVIERKLAPEYVTRLIVSAVRLAPEFHWLAPPNFAGTLTVLDVAQTVSAGDHETAVRRWANSVWHAWQPHHVQVRRWAERVQPRRD